MEKQEQINELAKTMSSSLTATQTAATDTNTLIRQIQDLSGFGIHEKTIDAILADEKTDIDRKLELIRLENADYDLREECNSQRIMQIQSNQTKNVGAATSWWGRNWGWIVSGVCSGLLFGTQSGRNMLSSAKDLVFHTGHNKNQGQRNIVA